LQQHAAKVLGLSSPQEWVMKKIDKDSASTTLNTLVIPRNLEDKIASVSTWKEKLKKAFFIPPYMYREEWASERMLLIKLSECKFVKDLGLEYELDS
jgi:hypothetical protein